MLYIVGDKMITEGELTNARGESDKPWWVRQNLDSRNRTKIQLKEVFSFRKKSYLDYKELLLKGTTLLIKAKIMTKNISGTRLP